MNEIIDSLFKLDYMPHGHCYWWKPEILWLNVIADVFIAFAYFSIPIAIYYFVKRRPDIEFKGVFILFSLFILCCGITHLISIVVIWHGSYGIHGLAKLVTAIVSCITAYHVYKAIPLALKIPSLNSLQVAYEQATKEKLARIQLENQKVQDTLLRDSTNNAQVGILVIDEQGIIILANSAACDIFEYSAEELEGENVAILIAESEQEAHQGLMQHFLLHPETNKKMATGRTVYGYSKFKKKVPIEIVLNHRIQNGKPVVYASILDVSARVAAEVALAKSESITHNIIQALPIGFHMFELVNNELIFRAHNPAADFILGIDNSELLGKTITEAFPGLEGQIVPEQLIEVAKTGVPRVNDINYYDDGLKAGAYLVHSFQSSANKVVVLFQDITEQKKTEQEIAAKEQFIRRAFDSSITGVYIYNGVTGINEFINESYTRITGLTLDDINNMDEAEFMTHFHPDDVDDVQEHMTQLFQSKDENAIFTIEYRFKHADGHWIWCLSQDVILERNELGDAISFMGSFLDITELKAMQENLIELKNSAEKANAIKSDFLANMSHEIRTPMNAILGLTHIVLEMDLGNKQREYLSKVETSSKSLLNILNDILDYSKMEAGKINIVHEVFAIEDVFESVTGLFTLLAEEKRVELIVELPVHHEHYFLGDQLRITQILNNIVGNALKFTEQGYVKLSLTITDIAGDQLQKQLAFSVEDTGIGMSSEQVEQLFISFNQADTSISRTFGGTGLGLSISKGLANSMGGEIKVSSTPYVGSTFTLELPLTLAPVNDDNQLVAPKPMSVLIVDDNDTSLITLEKLFLQWDFEVTTCNDSELALELFKQKAQQGETFELLVVDWKMPKIDGIELISLIQSQASTKDESLKILMVTAYGRKFAERSLEKQKIQGIIDKPVLTSKIHNILLELQNYGEVGLLPSQSNSLLTEELNLQNIHILLVEDNEMNQLVAQDILESFGANVVIAVNGQEAVELFAKQYFDLILMDLQMPVMDGFAATTAIRATAAGKKIPILAMSAAVMKADVDKVASSGMNDHIAKPIDIKNMTKVLTKWIKSDNKLTSVHSRTQSPEVIYTGALALLKEHDFNVEKALTKIGHRHALYLTLLKSFYREQFPNIALLKTSIAEDNTDFISRLAHSLKSLSATLGAEHLHNLACQAEQNNTDKLLLEQFAQAFELCCQMIDKALANEQNNDKNETSGSVQPVEDETEQLAISDEEITGILNSLQQTLTLRKFIDEAEFKAIKKVLLAKWSQDELSDLFEALDSLAYEQALLALNKLKEG